MSHFVHSWDGIRRSRIVQVLIFTFVFLTGGIALIATSSGDANARTPVATASCGVTWSLTTSGPALVWSNPAIWAGPVCGEYPGQTPANGGTQASPAVVNLGFNGSTIAFDPLTSNPITLTMQSATINVNQLMTLQGSSDLGSGGGIVNVNSGGTLTNTPGSTLSTNVDTLNLSGGMISNAGSISNSGTTNLNSGTLSGAGTLTNGTNLNITGPVSIDAQQINNNGTITLSSPTAVTLQNGVVITNNTTRTINVTGSGGFAAGAGAASSINNVGSFTTSAVAGPVAPVTVNFTNNAGSVTTNSRGLTFSGTNTISGGTLTTGAGLLTLGGSTTIPVAVPALTVAGTSALQLSGNVSLVGNIFGGAIGINSIAAVTGNAAGTSQIIPAFTNAGGTVKAASGILSFAGGYTQSSGNTIAGPGTLDTGTVFMTLNGGTLTGSGLITATSLINNTAAINPDTGASGGTINLTGNYTQGTGGALTTDLYSAVNYDQFKVSGTANLGGTYTALLQGGYQPPNATTFTPMTYASRSAPVFTTYSLPTYPGGGSFTQTTGPAALVLQAVVTQADLSTTQAAPASINHNSNATINVTILNSGPSTATSLSLTDTFSSGTYVSATLPGGTCTPSGSTVTCTLPSLASAGSAVMTLVLNGNTLGTITNSASVSSAVFDPIPGNNNSTASITVNPVADLTVSLITDAPSPVNAGSNVTYTVPIGNLGPDPSGSTTVTLSVTAGTIVSASGAGFTCTFAGTSGTCTAPSLASASSTPLTVTVTAPPQGGTMTLSANVSSVTFDPALANNSNSKTTTVTAQADLKITKTLASSLSAGQNATYTVTVTNLGPSDATGVSVSDTTPLGLVFVSNSGGCITAYPCALGTLTPAQVVTISSTYAVPASATGSVTNTATVSSATPDPIPANNSATSVASISVSADLSVVKTGPASAIAGTTVSYTTTVTNNGPADATGVTLTDPTPAGLTFVSATGACASFPCSLGTMTPSQVKTVIANYTISPSATSVTNTASVTSTSSDPVPGNNSSSVATTLSAQTDLLINKTLASSLVAGQNATYSITVQNLGPSTATGVVASDLTPAGTTFVSNSGGCTGAFPCTLGTLAPAQVVTITSQYAVSSSATGTLSNTATVSSSTTDPIPANNSSTSTSAITVAADVSVTKSGPASAIVGAQVTFNVIVSNAGPSDATAVTLNDPTPVGLAFVSATGACSSFPCSLGTIPSGQTRSVAATYTVSAASPSITNTATVTASSPDPSPANNSASALISTTCPTAPTLLAPGNGSTNNPTSGTLSWSNVGAASYKVYLSIIGSGCATFVGSTTSTSFNYTGLTAGATYEWHVEPVAGTCLAPSACSTFTTAPGCQGQPPTLISPTQNGTVSSPVTFTWSAVPGAVSYSVFVTPAGEFTRVVGVTSATSLTVSVPDGVVVWYVVADAGPGCQLQSASSSFNLCTGVEAPIASLVSEVATQQKYFYEWLDNGAAGYEVEESNDAGFTSVTTIPVSGTSLTLQHAVAKPTAFFYRVRGFSTCQKKFGPYSETARVVITPILGTESEPSANGQAGSKQLLVIPVKIPGFPEGTFLFSATVDQPWLTVTPPSGKLPPAGLTLLVTADPATLPNGTWTGTLFVTVGSTPAASGVHGLDNRTVTVPVSVNLVTPVATAPKGLTPPTALIIPSVGHLDGQDTRWQSDIRLANVTDKAAKYQLVLTPLGSDATKAQKQTSVSVESGGTMALDDIIRNWFGIGSLGESSNGTLQITPVDATGSTLNALVSSRTYDVTGHGTFGQFIPAVSFSKFVGKGASILGLQQIAQSDAFRTNLGLVEGSGQSASLMISVFDGSGNKKLEVPIDLKGGEQKQLNSFLAQYGVNLADGRIEVRVANGLGKVTAYASVIDRQTGDPLLVAAQPLGLVSATRYVLPAVTGLTNAVASLRTDMRLFNPATTSQPATLTFYPENNGTPQTANVLINAGEVKRLDDVLNTLFGTSGNGAVHVVTPNASSVVVTGRTYNQTTAGTYGQFVPAVTANDAIGKSGRSLNILQVEESVRYRTSVGVAEVTGSATKVEVSVVVPGSKVSPSFTFDLAPNEVRQFDVLHQLGLDNVYNVRIGVKVLDGTGKVTAYGSIVDLRTQDPTFVPAQ